MHLVQVCGQWAFKGGGCKFVTLQMAFLHFKDSTYVFWLATMIALAMNVIKTSLNYSLYA